MVQRVAVYIDGFNLYYGLRSKGWRRYYWLDLRRLSATLLRSNQRLVLIRYFTAPVLPRADRPGQRERQRKYLEALATLPDLHIHQGYFLPQTRACTVCGSSQSTYEEKMTDVNIAVELLGDAQDDLFDTAVIISGDSDLSGPVNAVRLRYPDKRVIVAFPPRRVSKQLRQLADRAFVVGRRQFATSQFPERIATASGYSIDKPHQWV